MAIEPGAVVLLDTCILINLYATGRLTEILTAVPVHFVVCDVVVRESHYVRRGGDGEDAGEREPVDLQTALDGRQLEIVASDDEDELLTYIDLTLTIDDGEAMSAALAIHRGWLVATDDRKALRLLNEQGVTTVSTLEIVRYWSQITQPERSVIQAVLRNIEQRGAGCRLASIRMLGAAGAKQPN